jgi:TetR/AcrR family transcriptional repressor of mexJK operon
MIREAATALFLERGYLGTSMDDIAAEAHLSKQTIYTHFPDKQSLFLDLVRSITETAETLVQTITAALSGQGDLESKLKQVARVYVMTVMEPERIQLRRLVIGESTRFPDMAREYYERAPERFFEAFATGIQGHIDSGELRDVDPIRAARMFAALVLWVPADRALFTNEDRPSEEELLRHADDAAELFVRAYRSDPCVAPKQS